MDRIPLVQILGCVLNEKSLCDPGIRPEQWAQVLKLAKRHKVANTLACALPLMAEEQKPGPEARRELEGIALRETMVSSNQLFAARELQQAFEKQGLYNMALKGINTKLRYPQDHMRSMGDLDILCKAEQNRQVKQAMEALGYGNFQEGRKHDHYTRLPFVTVEMHRELVAADSAFSSYYSDIWQRCKPLPGCVCSFEMTVEDEYIYNLIHLVEHFKEGGIGIRFVMDVYVYETRVELDRAYLDTQLEKLGLWPFHQNIVKLAHSWFGPGDQETDALIQKLGAYILSGGVYGSAENASALSVSKGGRLAFLIRACFPGYKEMCSMFPWLAKWPILLPYSWVLRAVRSLLHRRGNVRKQMDVYKNADIERGNQLREFYRECGLKDQ